MPDTGTWLLIVTALLIASLIVYYYSPTYVPKLTATAMGPYPLNVAVPGTTILKRDDTSKFTSSSGGTFSTFVYLNQANRTATYNTTHGGSFISTTNGYTLCTCEPTSCVRCIDTTYTNMINIGGIVLLNVLVAPDASRQGKATAQIVLQTNDAANKYHESYDLPAIELQKWVYITISREGRRVDIYYNNELVLSKTALYNLDTIGSTVTSGSPGLDGQLLAVNIYNYRLSTKDVSEKYAQFADSKGQPYFNDTSNPLSLSSVGGLLPLYSTTMFSGISSYIPTINLCPPGGCFNGPTIQPANPLYTWSTPYA